MSSYMEALGDSQAIASGTSVAFDPGSIDDVGNNITLSADGTTFTINRTGLYHVEWTLNLAPGSAPAAVGIAENGAGASGASSSEAGSFSSGTVISVDAVPFTLSLFNYGMDIEIERVIGFENTAASIRIVRFADGPSA